MGSGSLLPHRFLQPACGGWSAQVFAVIQYLLVALVASPPIGSVVVAGDGGQRHGASHLRPLLHPGAGRTAPTVRRATENSGTQGEGWSKAQFAQGVIQRKREPWRLQGGESWRGTQLGTWCGPRCRTHSILGRIPQRRTPVWGLAKGAVRPGCQSAGTPTLGLLREGNDEERSPGASQFVSQQPGGICVARASVRSVAYGRPERVRTAAPLPLLVGQQPYRSDDETAGRYLRSNRSVQRVRSEYPLRRLDVMGKEIQDAVLFL